MKVFEPLGERGYEVVNTVSDDDYEVIASLGGRPKIHDWRPIAVRLVRADKRQAAMPSDFPWLGLGTLVLKERAVEALRDMLDANGEILPLDISDGGGLYIYNAQVIEALDESASEIMRVPGTNRIMLVKKPAFVASALVGVDIFRLPHRASSTYVSDRFVSRVADASLVGITFNEVWSSAA